MNIRYPWFDEDDLFVWMQQGLWGNIKFYIAYAWFFTCYPVIVLGIALLCIWLLSGCGNSYIRLIDGLNARQIRSCLEYNGAANLGAGIGSGSGALHGITATGGALLEECRALLD